MSARKIKLSVNILPLILALIVFNERASAADISVTINATCEEQQVNQAGLVFNNSLFGQTFPTGPNYFASTRVTAGRRISYVVSVQNLDALVSANVVTTIILPPDSQLYQGSLSTTLGSCVPQEPDGNLSCDLGAMAASASGTISFQVVVDPAVPAGTVLVAGASAALSGDANLGNNFSSALSTVLAAADMTTAIASIGAQSSFNTQQGRIVDTAANNAVTAGNALRHRMEIQNNGPSNAPVALTKHSLPLGVIFEGSDGARCIPGGSLDNFVFCAVDNVAANSRAAYDLYLSVDPFVANGTALISSATSLSSPSNTSPPGPIPGITFDPPLQPLTWDPLTSNNTASNTTNAGVLVDAGVSFLEASVSANEHGAVHYRPNVSNDGRSGLLAATLTLTFPQGITPRGSPSTCSILNSTVTCAVMPLSPAESQTFDVVGSVELVSTSVSALTIQAVLSAMNPADANSVNNSASAISIVNPRFDNDDSKLVLSAVSSDFDIEAGTWGVNDHGDFFTFELGRAIALIKRAKLESFTSGNLHTATRLMRHGKSKPNSSIIFAHQDDGNYRYVKLEKRGRRGRVSIGQSGDSSGEKHGLKTRATYPLKLGKVYHINVNIAADGVVDVRINNSSKPVALYRFADGSRSGRVGFGAQKARAVYDKLSVEIVN